MSQVRNFSDFENHLGIRQGVNTSIRIKQMLDFEEAAIRSDTEKKRKLLGCMKSVDATKFTVDKEFATGFCKLATDEKIQYYCQSVHFLDKLNRKMIQMTDLPPQQNYTFQAHFKQGGLMSRWSNETISIQSKPAIIRAGKHFFDLHQYFVRRSNNKKPSLVLQASQSNIPKMIKIGFEDQSSFSNCIRIIKILASRALRENLIRDMDAYNQMGMLNPVIISQVNASQIGGTVAHRTSQMPMGQGSMVASNQSRLMQDHPSHGASRMIQQSNISNRQLVGNSQVITQPPPLPTMQPPPHHPQHAQHTQHAPVPGMNSSIASMHGQVMGGSIINQLNMSNVPPGTRPNQGPQIIPPAQVQQQLLAMQAQSQRASQMQMQMQQNRASQLNGQPPQYMYPPQNQNIRVSQANIEVPKFIPKPPPEQSQPQPHMIQRPSFPPLQIQPPPPQNSNRGQMPLLRKQSIDQLVYETANNALHLSKLNSSKLNRTIVNQLIDPESEQDVLNRIQTQNNIVEGEYTNAPQLEVIEVRQKKDYDIFHCIVPQFQLSDLFDMSNYTEVKYGQNYQIYTNTQNRKNLKLVLKLQHPRNLILRALIDPSNYRYWNKQIDIGNIKLRIYSQNTVIAYQKLKAYDQFYQQRDFLFLRHLFKKDDVLYMVDKSIQHSNFPPFSYITRGDIILGVWAFQQDSSTSCTVTHMLQVHFRGKMGGTKVVDQTIKYLEEMANLNNYLLDQSSVPITTRIEDYFDINWDISKNDRNITLDEIRKTKNNIQFVSMDMKDIPEDLYRTALPQVDWYSPAEDVSFNQDNQWKASQQIRLQNKLNNKNIFQKKDSLGDRLMMQLSNQAQAKNNQDLGKILNRRSLDNQVPSPPALKITTTTTQPHISVIQSPAYQLPSYSSSSKLSQQPKQGKLYNQLVQATQQSNRNYQVRSNQPLNVLTEIAKAQAQESTRAKAQESLKRAINSNKQKQQYEYINGRPIKIVQNIELNKLADNQVSLTGSRVIAQSHIPIPPPSVVPALNALANNMMNKSPPPPISVPQNMPVPTNLPSRTLPIPVPPFPITPSMQQQIIKPPIQAQQVPVQQTQQQISPPIQQVPQQISQGNKSSLLKTNPSLSTNPSLNPPSISPSKPPLVKPPQQPTQQRLTPPIQSRKQIFTSDQQQKKQITKPQQRHIYVDVPVNLHPATGLCILPNDYIRVKHQLKPVQSTYTKLMQPGWKSYFLRDLWQVTSAGELKFIHAQKLKQQHGIMGHVLSKFAKNLFSGKSILNISLPVSIFSELSVLQLTAKAFGFAPLFLEKAAKQSNPVERFKLVMAFTLGYSLLYLQMEKPFNPIIGQTYQGWLNGCPVNCQQISHHPPISAFYFVGRGYKIHGNIQAKIDLHMNSGVGSNDGEYVVEFDQFPKNKIRFRTPGGQVLGLSFGQRKFLLTGKSYLYEDADGYFCQLAWNPYKKGMFSFGKQSKPADWVEGAIVKTSADFVRRFRANSKRDGPSKKQIQQTVGNASGRWTESLKIDGVQYINIKRDQPCMLQQQKYPLNSNSNYRQDIIYRRKRDIVRAQVQKQRLQQLQRADRKNRQKRTGVKH